MRSAMNPRLHSVLLSSGGTAWRLVLTAEPGVRKKWTVEPFAILSFKDTLTDGLAKITASLTCIMHPTNTGAIHEDDTQRGAGSTYCNLRQCPGAIRRQKIGRNVERSAHHNNR